MKLLDLFSGAGGSAVGYFKAGFDDITGVDINPQKRYPFRFVQTDAIAYLKEHGNEYDVIHASPPCQSYSKTKPLTNGMHPRLIEEVREILLEFGKPYVIENVPGADLINPITLTGTMFGLLTVRARLFESNVDIKQPDIPEFIGTHTKMGRKPNPGEYVYVVGHITDVEYCKKAMNIDWMIGKELVQAIPPDYTEYIGKEVLKKYYAIQNE